MAYKPEDYSTVSPYLVVNNAGATIQFITEVLDGQEIRRFPAEGGGLMHAEVRLGDSVIMLADANENFPAAPAHVHVYCPDVDKTYENAVEAGAQSLQEPSQQEGETDRRAGVQHPAGTSFWFATQVA